MTLTIGFARRFATYKRAGLILQDVERLTDGHRSDGPADPDHLRRQGPPRGPHGQGADPEHRPVDQAGAVRQRIVFVEDYDMNVARQLVQGVDVWLNNPRGLRKPAALRARKAVFNGDAELLDPRRMVGRSV